MSSEDHDIKSKIFNAFEVFGNLFVLNALFILFSLPVITIGASTTALYSMTMKIVRKKEGGIWKGFTSAFKSNFKKATIAWMLLLLFGVVLFGEYLYVINYAGVMATFYTVVIVIELVLLAFLLPFLFPLIARYENGLWNTFKNAMLLSISNLWSWAKIVILWVFVIYFTMDYPIIFFYTWYLWLIIMFGLLAYLNSLSIVKVFDKFTKKSEDAQYAEKEMTFAEQIEKKKEEMLVKKESIAEKAAHKVSDNATENKVEQQETEKSEK